MDESKQQSRRFGPFTKGALVGGAVGFALGCIINLGASNGHIYWLADSLRMAAIGVVIGILFGLTADITRSLKQKS
jgi:hypothetical protein